MRAGTHAGLGGVGHWDLIGSRIGPRMWDIDGVNIKWEAKGGVLMVVPGHATRSDWWGANFPPTLRGLNTFGPTG